jgi:hypothetical protein
VTISPDECAILQNRGGWREDRIAGRCTFPIGPLNTWSNAAYLVAGGAVVFGDHSPAGIVMALALTLLGIGSGLYHGFKTRFANTLDWVGMYCVFGALVVHGIEPHNPATPFWMAGTGGGLALLFTYAIPKVSLEIQMGLLFYFASLPMALKGHWPMAISVLCLFLVAYAVQVGDRKGWTGRWGHAAWHLLSAMGITLLYGAQG